MGPFDPYRMGGARQQVVPVHVARQLQEERDELRRVLEHASEEIRLLRQERARLQEELERQQRRQQRHRLRAEEIREIAEARDEMSEALASARQEARAREVEAAALRDALQEAEASLADARARQQALVPVEAARGGEDGGEEARRRALLHLGDVRDSVSRALSMSEDASSQWHLGLEHILRQVDAALGAEQVEVLGLRGERFDPDVHEAVGVVADPVLERNVVTQTPRVGLRLSDGALLRAAQVVVSA